MAEERALTKCWSCKGRGFKYVSSRRALWPFSEQITLRRRPCLDCNGAALRIGRGDSVDGGDGAGVDPADDDGMIE